MCGECEGCHGSEFSPDPDPVPVRQHNFMFECSFCGNDKSHTKLVIGPQVSICHECAAEAYNIADQPEEPLDGNPAASFYEEMARMQRKIGLLKKSNDMISRAMQKLALENREKDEKLARDTELFNADRAERERLKEKLRAAEIKAAAGSEEGSFQHLQRESYEIAVEKGWWDDVERGDKTVIPEKLALTHSEISEALEEYRNDTQFQYEVEGKPEGLAIELADTVIRIFDLCGHLEIDLLQAVLRKQAYNRTRPPRHGGKVC